METESNLNFVRDSRTAQRVTEILREAGGQVGDGQAWRNAGVDGL